MSTRKLIPSRDSYPLDIDVVDMGWPSPLTNEKLRIPPDQLRAASKCTMTGGGRGSRDPFLGEYPKGISLGRHRNRHICMRKYQNKLGLSCAKLRQA